MTATYAPNIKHRGMIRKARLFRLLQEQPRPRQIPEQREQDNIKIYQS